MDANQAREALAQAQALETCGRRSGQWLVRWYVIFGVATVVVAAIVANLHTAAGMILFMLVWAAVIVGLSWWARSQKAAMRGMGRIHGTVIGLWAAAWAITVSAGSTWGSMGYLLGSLLCLVICLGGALYVHRKTS